MIRELLNMLGESLSKENLLSFLNNSSYDEMLGIDLNEDRFRFLYNIEGKYQVPATEGSLRNFLDYVLQHLIHEEDKALYAEQMSPQTLASRLAASDMPGIIEFEHRVRNPEGGWRWVEQVILGGEAFGMPDGVVYCYVYDIQNIKDREAGNTRVRSSQRVERDVLTGLLRDNDFYSAAKRLLADRATNWELVVIDLEQFKLFNEWYGRKAGDMVLARIGAGLLQDADRCDGLAGYMGNDDFCLLVPAGRVQLDSLYEKIHRVIVRFGVSIGFLPAFGVSYSNGNTSILNLFDQSSLACQLAKQDFKQRIRTFDPSMYNKTAEDYRILSEFQDALKNGEITFYLQPQCHAGTGGIVGAESLARWIKPDGRIVPPPAFVPVLEKYGFIPDLDKYIWESVCRWCRRCLDAGLPLIPVSVNVSQVDIFTMNVAEHFCDLVDHYRLPRTALKIEITESVCGEDSEKVRQTVSTLREYGFVVLMDDFGSGYSSLNMLHELNIDVIKLDAYFLHLGDTSDRKGMRILESIVSMAKTLALPIIVEGVETQAQQEYLMSLGCQYMQGYFFYKPMPAESFEALIADPDKVENRGFVFKANDQFRIREFLNDTIYSDSMLNNIIGPAAIYAAHDGQVDIVRFNQQFFEAVNVPDFHERLDDIQRFMTDADAKKLRALLARAYEDRLNGAGGVMSFSRIDGGYSTFLIHFFFLNESGGSRRFYGAARNVSEISRLSQRMELIARFSSNTVIFLTRKANRSSFEVVAHGLESSMGLSRNQLKAELDSGAFLRRLQPGERDKLGALSRECDTEHKGFSAPFTMRTDDGGALNLRLKVDYVDDEQSEVRCILSMWGENE